MFIFLGLHATVAPKKQDGQVPILEKLTFVPYMDDPVSKEIDVRSLNKESFLQSLQEGPLLKVMLDIVIENKMGANLKICEVGAGDGKVFSHVVPLLAVHPLVPVNYTVTDKTEEHLAEIKEAADNDTIEYCLWDVSKKPPGGIGRCDLVIASNLIHQSMDVSGALENIKSALNPKGFVLLHEVTASLETAKAIFGKNGFTASGQEQKFFLTGAQWEKVLKEKGLNVVALKNVGSVSSLVLCRIANVSTDARPVVIDVDEAFTFVSQLQSALAADDKSPIWVCARTSTPTGIVGMTNCLRQEMGGERIRCLLTSPDDNEETMAQMENLRTTDLVMNVVKDGKFGSYRYVRHLELSSDAVSHDE